MDNVFAFKGYFVASYTQQVGDGRYIGHAKLCLERPRDPASANALEKVTSVGAYPDEAKALQAAEFQARQVIEGLRPNWAPFTSPDQMISIR
ncbi:MAG TPA: hypothetical protein VHA82_03365 [Ramlibacter sp.]|uniref:hypothetical protein n=1 Tax=Ramlibacter sp. TaxID=1917967 RepID=UPI002CA828E8|nr:hypothetical protein [Ramlibacter sp.]HVZ42826.1 hypothetical protein [Ramlibacter sp.]